MYIYYIYFFSSILHWLLKIQLDPLMKQPSGIWYDIDTTTYVYIYKVPEPNWTAETRTDTERTGTKEVLVPS